MADAGKIVITPKGKYNSTTTYEWLDEVTYDGKAYIALKTVTGVTPSDDGVNWRLFLEPNDIVAGNLVPTFTEASTRSNIISEENLSTILGKVKKYFTDLKGHAFNDTVKNLTTEETGSVLDASQGKVLKEEVDETNSNLSDYGLDGIHNIEMLQGYPSDNDITVTHNNSNYVCSKNTYECNGDDKIVVKNKYTNGLVYFYDSSKAYISGSEFPCTAPTNAKYFRFRIGYVENITPQTVGKISVYINNAIDEIKNDLGEQKKIYSESTINVGRKASTTVGEYSTAEGYGTTASGNYSHAEGRYTTASGNCSHAEGYSTTALDYQHAQGHYNNTSTATANSTNGTSTGTAFVIGNGTSSSKSNAFRVTGEGVIYSTNSSVQTGADYAEYFEWSDENPDSEDRVGYFVTLDEDNPEKIRIANNGDYILGIVSGMPSVIGNGDECWKQRYILDEFGRYIVEEFEYEVVVGVDEETGKEIKETKIGTKWKENPDYDSTKPYIPRKERAEWSAIGMVGVLSVYDDGSCKVNGYCKVADGGIATEAEKGDGTYRVIKRVNENIVKIVLK